MGQDNIGRDIFNFAKELWPINRSITGEGVRKTLTGVKSHLPDLNIRSIETGRKVFDWVVPKEWHVNEAYIITPDGDRICDFDTNNLHLVGYSVAFKGCLTLDELTRHLHFLPEQPSAIPYVTSYYNENWGFCISFDDFKKLKPGEYNVVVDTTHLDGYLNYGEFFLQGKSNKEVLLSSYVCHPSLANNELSGPCVLTYIGKWLQNVEELNFSYRLLFVPETIGSIAYISQNKSSLKKNVFAGFNVTCVGDNRCYSFLPSRKGNTLSDRVAKHVLYHFDKEYKKYTWLDRGSDERQYCAPGIDLPIASIMRSKYGCYDEYHTSEDKLGTVVTEEGLEGGYSAIRRALEIIEMNKVYVSNIFCEPQMGKRGLYHTIAGKHISENNRLRMDILSLCDGENSILDIAEILKKPFWEISTSFTELVHHDLISEIN